MAWSCARCDGGLEIHGTSTVLLDITFFVSRIHFFDCFFPFLA